MIGWLLKLVTGNPVTLLWIGGGLFAAGLAMGGSGAWWLQGLRLDACNSKVEANKVLIQSLGDKIADQNAAVEALDAAGKAAKAKGAKAVAAARQQALGLQGEVARLSALLKQAPNAARTCQDAVTEARKGLAP